MIGCNLSKSYLSRHIAHGHANDPIPDIKVSSSVKSKSSSPKYRLKPVPIRKPKPKLRRGQHRSEGRIRRTYLWKLRHVLKWERLEGTWNEKKGGCPSTRFLNHKSVSGVDKKTNGKSGLRKI